VHLALLDLASHQLLHPLLRPRQQLHLQGRRCAGLEGAHPLRLGCRVPHKRGAGRPLHGAPHTVELRTHPPAHPSSTRHSSTALRRTRRNGRAAAGTRCACACYMRMRVLRGRRG
jgi:hypothetical protein